MTVADFIKVYTGNYTIFSKYRVFECIDNEGKEYPGFNRDIFNMPIHRIDHYAEDVAIYI